MAATACMLLVAMIRQSTAQVFATSHEQSVYVQLLILELSYGVVAADKIIYKIEPEKPASRKPAR